MFVENYTIHNLSVTHKQGILEVKGESYLLDSWCYGAHPRN
jgi:hypothetical protein